MPELLEYAPHMQAQIEGFFSACCVALDWLYEPQGRHADVLHIPEVYQKNGHFWCLFDAEALIATVALRSLEDTRETVLRGQICNAGVTAEMKRLYVLPQCQGKGYGGFLFKTALDEAKISGFQMLRLDTREDRAASRHLIDKYQFRRIEKYNKNAFAQLYYELDLQSYNLEE